MTVNTVRAVSPNQPKTPLRSMRISDELWELAKARAHVERETVTDVVRRALEEYVADWSPADGNES